MQPNPRPVTQALLSADLNDLAHSLARELAMAFRKVSIYGPSHPLSLKSLEKPYLICNQFFRFRKFVSINIMRGNLYVANIALKDSVFNTQIMQYCQMLEMKAILLGASMTSDEFLYFVSTMVNRETLYDAKFSMMSLLKQKGISSISVSSELAYDLFENRKQYRGDVDGDFSVKRMALDMMGGSIDQLSRLSGITADQLMAQRIDINPEIIAYLLPERVAMIPWSEIRGSITELGREINDPSGSKSISVDQYMSIFKLIELHPDREKIVSELNVPANLVAPPKSCDDANSRTGQIRIESSRRLEQLLDKFFSLATQSEAAEMSVFIEFGEAYSRLLKTGQAQRAHEVLVELQDRLSSPDAFVRQKSLDLLVLIVNNLNLFTDRGVLEAAVQSLDARLREHKESYEYSELIWCVARKCLAGKRYDLFSQLVSALAGRRRSQDSVTTYDSMTIKKAFENVNQPEVVSELVESLIKARAEDVAHIKSILIGIGSEDIALALSHIISHPQRQVRQLSLKILAELGKNSLRVFSDMLVDDSWFDRDKQRHELPDERWYIIRNAIFVLGSLRDVDAVTALRLRINDQDIRIRREIISSLEKIEGEDAIDLLIVMAEDRDKEIREAALGALGMVGKPECVPLVIDLTKRNPADSIRTVAALGKIGGTDAKCFLGSLLNDEEALNKLAAGKVSREDLRAAIVRALGNIGDADSISKIRAFQGSFSAAQKLLMRGSTVQKAIAEVLSRY